MVDFKQMPPVDIKRRIEKLKTLTRLQNGAKFEFSHTLPLDKDDEKIFAICGRYLDYTGEWCKHTWNRHGKVIERKFAEMDIDWTSGNG